MTGPIPLSQASLGLIGERTLRHSAGQVPVPAYDRALVTPGVVHIGVGGFHRAHQAMYHDQLMNHGTALDWGICGVGVLPPDMRMRQVLDAQDGLYTLVLKHNDGTWEPRVIGSIVEYLYAPDDPEAVIERMAASSTRIVSLTITEGGYNVNDTTGEFDKHNPDVTCDLAPGAVPRTVFGLVTEALRRRRRRGLAPFTIMSCDNLPGNGQLSKTAFTAFARLRDPDLGDWIERETRFPDSMVDRITPATTDADRAEVRAVVASWARYAEGTDEQGQPIEVVDRLADRLIRTARRQCEDPLAFIADQDLFGELADDQRFTAAYTRALASLHVRGARATLESLY